METVKMTIGLQFILKSNMKTYTVVSREKGGVNAEDSNGNVTFIPHGSEISTDVAKSYRVKDAGDGMAGYVGLVDCAMCRQRGIIHPGGGNMCAICVMRL